MLGILSKILTAQENLRQQQQQSLDRRTQEIENVSNLLGIFERVIQKVMFPWNR
jgi:DNA-binding protein H-NS